MRCFGHAVGFEHWSAERLFHLVHHFRRQRGAARTDESQVLGALRPLLAGSGQEKMVNGRDRRIPGRAVIAHRPPKREWIEFSRHHHGSG